MLYASEHVVFGGFKKLLSLACRTPARTQQGKGGLQVIVISAISIISCSIIHVFPFSVDIATYPKGSNLKAFDVW